MENCRRFAVILGGVLLDPVVYGVDIGVGDFGFECAILDDGECWNGVDFAEPGDIVIDINIDF
jgi:hypothetical protein